MGTIIYIRTSTEEQNPENQLKDCESIRPKDNKQDTFQDYKLFEEKQSAWNEKSRPELNKIRTLIKQKQINHLIVWDLDRLYRNRKNLIAFFEYCKTYGCTIHSYRQKWLEDIINMPNPWNEIIHELMLQIMGWLSQDESDKKSKRVKAAVRTKKGVTVSYKGNRWGRRPVSTFKRNKVLKLKDKLSIRKIAQEVGLGGSTVHKIISENKL